MSDPPPDPPAAAAPGAASRLRDRLLDRVVPAVPVPFTAGGDIDLAAQETYAAWMATQPCGAVAVWAHTGRGLLLGEDQRAAVLAAWRAAAPEVPIMCGVGVPRSVALPSTASARTDAACRAAEAMATEALEGGASGVLIHPPAALAGLPDAGPRILAYHEAVLSAGLPGLAFYLYEAAGGVTYSDATVEALVALDGIAGIKVATLDSVMTFQDLAAGVARVRDALLVTGEDRFLGYSLLLGARSALVGLAAAGTDVCAALVAAAPGDADAFLATTRAVDRFAAATFVEPMEGYVQRMLWALEADGVLQGRAHDPFGPRLPQTERARVFAAVHELRAS